MLYTSLGVGKNLANKNFYLIDSLDLNSISDDLKLQLDTLLTKFHDSENDTLKCYYLNKIAANVYDQKVSNAYNNYMLHWVNQKLITEKGVKELIRYKKYKISGLLNRGYDYDVHAQTELAIKDYQLGVKIANDIEDYQLMGDCYNSMSLSYLDLGRMEKALECGYKAIDISIKIGNKKDEANALINLGGIYYNMGQPDKTVENFEKALKIYEELGDLEKVMHVNSTLASFSHMSGNLQEAIGLQQKVLTYYEEKNDKLNVSQSLHSLGRYYTGNDNDKALEYYYKSLEIKEEIEAKDGISYTLMAIASIERDRGNLKVSKQMGERSFDVATEIGFVDNIIQSSQFLKDLYLELEDYQKAYNMLETYTILKDSIANQELKDLSFEKETQYKYEKKKALDDAENEKKLALEIQKKRQNQIIVFFVIGIAILLILMLVVIVKRLRLIKHQKQLIEEQAQKLKELDQTKTKFFNNVAHELKTPLTLISGHMESMLNDRFGGLNDNQRKSIQVAKKNNDRLVEMVSEILALGKLESSKMELNTEQVSLASFVDRIFFTFESYAQQFDIELIQQIDIEKNILVNIDSGKIEKVLNNLISNAIKYTPRGGQVILHIYLENGQITCAVKDSGIGISKSEISKVFDRYYQSSSKKMIEQGGTGIGLTIVKEYMELHNGIVSVSSEEGKGSTFTIVFPPEVIVDKIASQPIDKQEEENLSLPEQPILKESSFNILVVEDNREMQHYLKDILSDFAKVFVANDGIDALEILSKNKIDLMTIDLMMPNMGGFELLSKLKANSEYKDISTIMLTARSAEEDKLNALSIGIDDYITKPFSQKELIARVANLLQNRKERLVEISNSDKPDIDKDQAFLVKLKTIVSDNLSSSDFGVAELANQMALGDKQLTRTVKRITGLTPLKFIREVKLLAAQDLLKSKKYHTVAEVCYAVGFEKPSYFTQLYTERFGKLPSEYLS